MPTLLIGETDTLPLYLAPRFQRHRRLRMQSQYTLQANLCSWAPIPSDFSQGILAFAVNADGSLTSVNDHSNSDRSGVISLVPDRWGQYLYALTAVLARLRLTLSIKTQAH